MNHLTHTQLMAALQQLIAEKNITQTELSKITGFTQGNISRMFKAKYAPQLDHFLDLLNVAGISLAELEVKAVSLSAPVNAAVKE